METKIEEIWLPAYEFEGYYEVSNLGRLKSISRLVKSRWRDTNKIQHGKILNPGVSNGYYKTTLCKEGVLYYRYVHRLVMATFVGPSKLEVDHKDENKLNNRVTNLRYATSLQNQHYYAERRKANVSSKYVGVNFSPWHGNKWRAGISICGKQTHLGYFNTEAEAYMAYQKKRNEIECL